MTYTITMLIDGVDVAYRFAVPTQAACINLRDMLLLYKQVIEASGVVSAVCG